MQNKLLSLMLVLMILLKSQATFAAEPPPSATAGRQIKQIPVSPTLPKVAPEIRIEQGSAPATTADETKIIVKSLRLTGALLLTNAKLLALTGFKSGSELSLNDLRNMAAKITEYYHKQGYFVAQAYLPAQAIKDGVVTINVLEGQYGKVTLRNQTKLSDNLANGLLGGLKTGAAILIAPLERSLLLLSDIPGVGVKSTLLPGASLGTSDLLVDLTPGELITGSIDADNHGNRYTGENRLGTTINLNNPMGRGDIATLRVLSSGAGLNYARGSYQAQINKLKIGAAYASMKYALGQEFESLQANGTAQIASVYTSYPLLRSRHNNLYAQLAFDSKTFRDKVDSTPSVTDKKAGVLMASLNGDQREFFGSGSLSSYALTWTSGNLDLQTPSVVISDAASMKSNGRFDKLSFDAMWLQSMSETSTLYAAISGQLASKNLDTSEKMALGGANAVRAFPTGETIADQGYVLTLEARKQLPQFFDSFTGQLQVIGFIDTGTVTQNKNPWVPGPNSRTLSGGGLGLTWVASNNFVVKTYYAHKIGNEVATSVPDSPSRFWLQAIKYF